MRIADAYWIKIFQNTFIHCTYTHIFYIAILHTRTTWHYSVHMLYCTIACICYIILLHRHMKLHYYIQILHFTINPSYFSAHALYFIMTGTVAFHYYLQIIYCSIRWAYYIHFLYYNITYMYRNVTHFYHINTVHISRFIYCIHISLIE